jgi:hypothetical protein
MRLAQISRKVKVKPAEIRSFIKDTFHVELDKDPNIKLEQSQVDAILENFKVEEVVEEVPEVVVEEVVEEEIEIDPTIETDVESLKEAIEETVVEEKIEIPEIVEEVVAEEEVIEEEVKVEKQENRKTVGIQHASEEELAALKAKKDEEDTSDFKAVEVDENAALIAAEVEKLEGLTVVGKIELEDDAATKKLLKEEVELPSLEAIENEIDSLDGDLDTSEFTELGEGESDEAKEAIFAELDAQMANSANAKVKKVKNKTATEVSENVDEEEDSIYKDSRGIYHFTSQQRANRRKSLAESEAKKKAKLAKEKKARHYQENIAKNAAPPKKKNAPSKKAVRKQEAIKKKEEAPKSLWGKFKNWLNDRN